MTFSIVARSADGTSWGVAVASKFLAAGSAVPAAVAGIGAIATQALANVSYKAQALALLDEGATASVALQRLIDDDEGRDQRQVGIVDLDGLAATYTGAACLDWAGGETGEGVAIQGNILTGPEVVAAMRASWDEGDPAAPLAERLLAALRAGDEAGGDRRGRESAALLVVTEGGGIGGFDDVQVDLRVDHHDDPVTELEKLLAIHGTYFPDVPLDERVPDTPELMAELDSRARSLGLPGLMEWMGQHNLEGYGGPDWTARTVVDRLRAATPEWRSG
ncbi:DUF1028 domain-containing protein [Knoellia sp. CPCC 206435]|uniref:DUF1028 domain-containing protein n=1 Tax=Knoellia terrae TaxID=3404797 RepID=UPI003B42961E